MVFFFHLGIVYIVLYLQWIEDMRAAGADQYTFHYEATEDPTTCIRKIKEAGMKVRDNTIQANIVLQIGHIDIACQTVYI